MSARYFNLLRSMNPSPRLLAAIEKAEHELRDLIDPAGKWARDTAEDDEC